MQCNIAMVFILVFQPFHRCDGGCSKGLLPTLRGCSGKNREKMLWPFFCTKLSKLNQFFPCIRSFMWHLLSSCSEVVLWRTDLCFHWGKTVKSLESSTQGCNTVWQLKALETAFSFTESLLRRSFEVHDSPRSMLSCFMQNFIPYSKNQYYIQNFPWSHEL